MALFSWLMRICIADKRHKAPSTILCKMVQVFSSLKGFLRLVCWSAEGHCWCAPHSRTGAPQLPLRLLLFWWRSPVVTAAQAHAWAVWLVLTVLLDSLYQYFFQNSVLFVFPISPIFIIVPQSGDWHLFKLEIFMPHSQGKKNLEAEFYILELKGIQEEYNFNLNDSWNLFIHNSPGSLSWVHPASCPQRQRPGHGLFLILIVKKLKQHSPKLICA